MICYRARMAGRRWEPSTDEQQRLLDEAVTALRSIKTVTEHAWKLAAKAVAGGVPKTRLAKDSGLGTATVDRHLGPDEKRENHA